MFTLELVPKGGLQVARGAANILNLNSALIVIPVCRNFINFTRGLFEVSNQKLEMEPENYTETEKERE